LHRGDVAAGDLELIATIARPARVGFFRTRPALLAEADDLDAAAIDPAIGEVALCRCSAALAKGKVVLVGAAAVGVARNADPDASVLREN